MHASSVMTQLSTFGKNDLLQIQQLTNMLLGTNINNTPDHQDDNDMMLFDSVRVELAANGLNGRIPYTTLKESKFYKQWCNGLGVVNQFVDTHFKDHINRKLQRVAICRIIVQILISELRRQNIPVSLGTIARNMHRVPQAFDNQFPGYLQCGLAYLIVKSMTPKRK